MKLGIVCPYNLFLPGGVLSLVFHQAAELRRRGHEVTLITPRPQGTSGEAPDGVVYIGHSARIRAQQTWADVSANVDPHVIDNVLELGQFDLIHVHEPLIPFLAIQLLARVSCPTVGTFHAAVPDTILAKSIAGSIGPYKRSVFKRLNAVTAVSKAATGFILTEVDAKDITIIPNGIEAAQFAHEAIAPANDRPTVLYVGRLEKRKGVRYLIDAYAQLKLSLPQARLIVAGDGPERNALATRARQLKIKDCEFVGQVSETEKVKLLQACTVFAAPAPYGESFGIVLLEAMASGAVTVAGANPGYESVLTGTGRLSLIDPKDTTEFARRLALMATDQALRNVWLEWAKHHVQAFSYERIVDQYVAVYQKLVVARR